MNDGSALVFFVGLLVTAIGIGFYVKSLPIVIIIVGVGVMLLAIFDGMLTYLNNSTDSSRR